MFYLYTRWWCASCSQFHWLTSMWRARDSVGVRGYPSPPTLHPTGCHWLPEPDSGHRPTGLQTALAHPTSITWSNHTTITTTCVLFFLYIVSLHVHICRFLFCFAFFVFAFVFTFIFVVLILILTLILFVTFVTLHECQTSCYSLTTSEPQQPLNRTSVVICPDCTMGERVPHWHQHSRNDPSCAAGCKPICSYCILFFDVL